MIVPDPNPDTNSDQQLDPPPTAAPHEQRLAHPTEPFARQKQEPPTPMIDIHPAHHAASTWRDFFIHIATIVLGLLIAVGLEQTVEYFHRHHRVRQMEEDLRAESLENRHIVADDLPALQAIIASVDANVVTLKAHRNAPEKEPLILAPRPTVRVFVPIDTAWLGMRDSALISIVPRRLSTNYWKLDHIIQRANLELLEITQSRDKITAIEDLATPAAPLSAAERNDLLLTFSQYRQQLDRMRNNLIALDVSIALALEDKNLTIEATNDALNSLRNK